MRGRFDKESEEAHKAVEGMLRQHAWLKSERELFGKKGSDYDWEATNPKKAAERMREVVEQQERLGKKINKKVMGMFDKAEQEYQEVMEKKRIVENDKMKIEAVMAELDEKKVRGCAGVLARKCLGACGRWRCLGGR